MLKLKYLTVSFLAPLILVACGGGGGGGSDSGFTNPYDADATYTGTRTQATITNSNQIDFMRALYGVEYEGVSLASTEQNAAIQEHSFSNFIKGLTTLALRSTQRSSGYTLAATAAISETIACKSSGTMKAAGEVDNQTGLGVLTLTMTNCVDTLGKANGTVQVAITGYDTTQGMATAFTLTFQNLKVNYSVVSYTAVGTQSYSSAQGIETTTSNIYRMNHNTNKQSLVKNYKVVTSSAYATTFKLSGQVYLQDYGYATLSTLSNVTFSDAGIPVAGKALLSGASSSKLRMTASNSSLGFELDSNGDNTYEETGYITLLELFGDGDYCISGC
ncbi:hypothetical protein [Thiofilum flexile]|uniref:hypothetical protein n=1 Tax=Thiofilum flexile TaxID=125627 RepID=UPI00037EA7EA|nr:hypothetical protein [Thiofilum flexile]